MKIAAKSILAALALSMAMIPSASHALGKREKNILATLGGIAVIGAIAKNASAEPAPRYHAPHHHRHHQDLGYKLDLTAAAFDTLSRNERRDVQAALRNAGVYQGRIDGQWGRGTRAAFLALMQYSPRQASVIRDTRSARRVLLDIAYSH